MSTIQPPDRQPSDAGFTLIEVLVALVVLAVSLSSIEALVAANLRSVRKLHERLAMVSVARTVESMIPDAKPGETDDLSGRLRGYDWRIDFEPFVASGLPASATWTPRVAAITVTAPSGAAFTLDALRLSRNPPQ